MELTVTGSVVTLRGPLDGRCTAQVRPEIYERLAVADHVVVDLSAVTWVDAAALRMLAAASRRAACRGARLTLRGGSCRLRRAVHRSPLRECLTWETPAAV